MNLANIRKNENMKISVDCNDGHRSGWLQIEAGLTGCFVDLVIDCGDVCEGRELYGNILAKRSTLEAVIALGGFKPCDYGLGDFMLSDYDKRVTLPAVLLWYHGREYMAEDRRLDGLYQRTAPAENLPDISLPDSNKTKLAGFDTAD